MTLYGEVYMVNTEKVELVQEATGKIQENVNEQLNRLNNIKQ